MIDGMQYLSEDIQGIVIENGWSQFTPIQKMSFKLTKESDFNLILMGPTGCGKTEAALFPILSKVDFSQPGVKVLYISPLRALINDQTKRFEELGSQLDFRVTKWHMDAKQSEKASLVRNPEGALLITPESLEAMFQNHPEYIKPLFQSLDYVIVDEIHVFCGTDRGVHLQSLLSRLKGYCSKRYRFYGLSATIGGDLSDVKSFVGDFENTKVLRDDNLKETDMTVDYFPEDEEANCEKEQASLAESIVSESQETEDIQEDVEPIPVEDIEIPEEEATENEQQPSESEFCEAEDIQEDIEKIPVADKEIPEKETTGNEQLLTESESREAEAIKEYKSKLPEELIEKLKGVTEGKNALVFCNSRGMVEEIAVALKGLSPDMVNNIFSHHAAISKSSRESTEQAAKEGLISPYVICCTNTLELGIDIGNLDMICQVDSTYSVSSLIQRAGRSGRRGGKATIYVCCSEDWNLIRSIACCNMYRNGMIEAPRRGILWYNVVLQQILSIVREKQVSWDTDTESSKLSAEAIADIISPCDAFYFCTRLDIHTIVEYLIKTEVLEEMEGNLIIGEAGKKLVGKMDSYTAYSTPHNYSVLFKSKDIGEYDQSKQIAVGSCFLLDAKVWQVTSIDSKKYVIHVKPAAKGKKPNFISEAAPISREIEQEMQRLCTNQEQYPFVSESCLPVISEKRQSFEGYDTVGSLNTPVCKNEGGVISIYPFQGTRIYNTLILLFNAIPDDYALRIGMSWDMFISKCRDFLSHRPDIVSILQDKLESGELRASAKLEKYLPLNYQAKLESTLKYDLDGTLEFLASLLGKGGVGVPTTEEERIKTEDESKGTDIPSSLEESYAQEPTRDRKGNQGTMEGDVYVLNIWAGNDWNRQLKDETVKNLEDAQEWLVKKAKEYGKDLKFHNFDAPSGNYAIPASFDSGCTSLSPIDYLKEMNFSSEEQFMDFVEKENTCSKAIILVFSPKIGRSYACNYSSGYLRGIASLFLLRGEEIPSGVICHEISHLFNAPDLYEEEQSPEVVEYIKNKYPNEVMLGGQGEFETMELSPITAYYLGLCNEKDGICDSINDNRH